ncbi:DUF2634 domain-containing protein [Tindallia californiensis]|uniref:DUF2634 domain-containing protein n=1 Tax=Tindallia californiensis TaxID=159292 RepID=A0A1H3R0Y0_9FIRM|nr:DUF2634 domain-containing protein [Tindallia californiensis]SDZ19482.1 Protein of unknown function [Tindallia californiensis]
MSLPDIAKLEYTENDVVEKQQQRESRVYKTLVWDFEKGDFELRDGKTLEADGKKYLKIWIKKTLLTIKSTLIFEETEYGSEHYSLIGSNLKPTFVEEEMKRMIREALIRNSAVRSVSNFEFEQEGSRLKITFDVDSIFGILNGEVGL